MKSWKWALGLGAACATCCAIPLLGVAGGVAAFGSALWACAVDLAPAALLLGVVAGGLVGAWAWRRRQLARRGACGCAGTTCS